MQILHLIPLLIIMTISNFSLAAELPDQAMLSNNQNKPKLLFMAGSARKESVNKMLAYNAFKIAKTLGANGTFIDLKDFPLPIYDGDLESGQGLPKKANELKKIFAEHDGIFIASPEYNGSITPLLKNTLDWVSRSNEEGESPLKVYKNKVVALCSASPSNVGGQRGLISLQMMLNNIGVIILPQKVSITGAYDKFNEKGLLNDVQKTQEIEELLKEFIRITTAIKESVH